MTARAAALLLALLALAPGRAAAEEARWRPPDLHGARVDRVVFQRTNVFDPSVKGEDWWLFRLANRIHFITREPVIERELLFGFGDPWDPLAVIESERNLRSNGSFRRAEIVPIKNSTGTVDVIVRTQDAWTTNVRANAGTAGGESYFGLGFEEDNLLGYGKSVSFDVSRSGPHRDTAFGYGDPRFLGTRLNLTGSYDRGDLGDSAGVSLTRPFYALSSHRAESMSWSRSIGDGTIYRDGEERSKFRLYRRKAEASVGARLNSDRLFVQRVEAGWYSDRLDYSALDTTVPGYLPASRELNGPTFGYSWVQPRYIKETYIDRMERVEDFNLGNELNLHGGWMGRATGSDRDRLLFSLTDQQGFALSPGRFAIARVTAAGRAAGGKAENVLVTAGVTGYWKTLWPGDQTLVLHAEAASGHYLDKDMQLVLGGASGLRGYRNNSFVGGQALLVNAEDRFFFDREWLHLFRLGGAAFMDSGTVTPEGVKPRRDSLRTDVGAGLRMAATRSRSGAVLRFDLAYQLNDGPGRSRWVVTILGGQAFSVFNSASQRVEAAPTSRLD